jgi:hypothetical protein
VPETDYYQILGVDRAASPEVIRAAHRAQSRRYHPDTADDGDANADLFTQIQEAYEVLSNSDTRRRYDSLISPTQTPAPRRPTKTPCAVCQKPVYASQLTLYLGRHMCKRCLEKRQSRESARPQLSGMKEFLWRLRCMRVWMQSHLALIVMFVIATTAVAIRLTLMVNHAHRPARVTNSEAVSDTPDPIPLVPVSADAGKAGDTADHGK